MMAGMIETEWQRLRAMSKLHGSHIQEREARMAFFAGASSMFKLMADNSVNDESVEQTMARVERLKEELIAFTKEDHRGE